MFKTGDITNFKHLSNFNSLKNFNDNIEMWLADYKKEFTKKELIILKRLIRFSAKVYGVSNVSIKNLLKAVELHDNVKVSEATFHRMKRKAVRLGILTIFTTKRHDNSQSTNLYVFNCYSAKNDIPCDNQKDQKKAKQQQLDKNKKTGDKTSNNYKTNNINKRIKYDYTFVSSNVPKKFVQAVAHYFPFAKQIYEIYKRLRLATRQAPDSIISNLDDYIKTLKEVIYRAKTRHIRSFYGYLYGAFKNTCNSIIMSKNATRGLYYDWLN